MSAPSSDPIAEAREIALALLKPSQRDLDYGLALHRESLVVESYSLGLHAPVVPEVLNRAMDEGASQDERSTLQEEMIMTGWAATDALQAEYREAWEASGVTAMFLNAGQESNTPLRLIRRFARYVALTDALPEILRRAVTVEDIRTAHREGKRCLCLAPNGIPLAGDQDTVEDELQYLRVFAQLGARMMHLTYNRRNPIGDGCAEPADAGLSHFGRAVIAEMNRLGIIIDVAHTGWRTSREAAEASAQPIVASHTASWELSQHSRCKPDEVIRAIVERGGTVGVTNVPRFVGGDGTILALFDHIDYIAKKFGADAVTIGTDSAYRSRHTVDGTLKGSVSRPRWEYVWRPGDEVYTPDWTKPEQLQSMAWTNWPLFTVGLVQRGYSDEDIRKIIGGNILRVAKQVWRPLRDIVASADNPSAAQV